MKKLILIVLFLCVATSAYGAKMVAPAPPGSGTFAKLGADADFEDVVADSVTADEMFVGRVPTTDTILSVPTAITEDDSAILGNGDFDNTITTPSVGLDGRPQCLRFIDLGIPQGAIIKTAQIQMEIQATKSDPIKWKLGIVNETAPIAPVDPGTFPQQEDLIAPQSTGTTTSVTEDELTYFPLTSTNADFIAAIQSLVDNSSWGASSAIMAVISDDGTIGGKFISTWHFNVQAHAFPTLVITYSEALEYVPVAALADRTPEIMLPDTLYSHVGEITQFFTMGIIEAFDPYALSVTMEVAGLGNAFPRYFEITPEVGDIGTEDFVVTVLDTTGEVLTTKTVDLVISADPDGKVVSPSKNILLMGDSLFENQVVIDELYRRMFLTGGTPDGDGITGVTFVGDRDLTTYTGSAAFTAWSGWGFEHYLGDQANWEGEVTTVTGANNRDNTCVGSIWRSATSSPPDKDWYIEYVETDKIKYHRGAGSGTLPAGGATMVHQSGTCSDQTNIVYSASTATESSPFWTETALDFAAWETRNVSSGNLDHVYVLLGWNSLNPANDLEVYYAQVRTFLDALKDDIDGVTLTFVGLQVPSPSGVSSTNFSSLYLAKYYPLLQTANKVNNKYQAIANETEYSSWVDYISVQAQFDSEYNYDTVTTDVNTRNSATEEIGDNGRHPSDNGYHQISDAVYRHFVGTFLE